jgi:hypothetical protein
LKRVEGLIYIDGPLWAEEKATASEDSDSSLEDDSTSNETVWKDESDEDDGIAHATKEVLSQYEIHRRLGHTGRPKQQATLKTAYLDKDIDIAGNDFDCEPCSLGKSKRQVSRAPRQRAKLPGQVFHIDTQEMKPLGPSGERYWVVVTDDCTRWVKGKCFKNKNEISPWLTKFTKKQLNLRGRYPILFITDGGSEFFKFARWAKDEGLFVETG